jgi:hypothetical protein
MKNIFEVDSNEIKRILSLHEESTKKQYLNVLNEAGMSDEGNYLNTNQQINNQPVKPKPDALASYTTVGVNNLENVTPSQLELEFYRGTKFVKKMSKTKIPYLISQLVTAKFKGDIIYDKANDKPIKGKVIYWCSGKLVGKYQFRAEDGQTKKNEMWYDDGDLTPMLSRVCKYKSPNPIIKPEIKKDEVKKGVVTKQPVNAQTFATQNTDLTKQIQTSLGNTAPTGQITDTDLDLILTQLKQV